MTAMIPALPPWASGVGIVGGDTNTVAVMESARDGDASLRSAYEGLGAIVEQVEASSKKIIMLKLMELLNDKNVVANMRNGMMSYIYAAGLLSFSGREISRKSMASVIRSIGIRPDGRMIDLILGAGIRSHLVYVYAFYFLLANGIEPTVKGMMGVASSLGVGGDESTAREIFDFVSMPR